MDEVLVDVLVEVLDAERRFDASDAVLGRDHRALRFIDLVVPIAVQPSYDACELVIEVGGVVGASGDDQRRTGFVDKDRVHLVDDRKEVAALHLLVERPRHVVAEVIEPELVVRPVREIGEVRSLLLLKVLDLWHDHPDIEAEKPVDTAHPFRVPTGEVIVDGDDVHSVSRERVQVDGKRRNERLALTGLHLGHPTEMQRRAAHDLNIEVALAERPPRGFAHGRERLREEVLEGFEAVVPAGRIGERRHGVEARPVLDREGPQFVV